MQADYVIVGAGSAGCVLANRLTEDPATRVVLIEAGGRDWNPLIHIPAGFMKLLDHPTLDLGLQGRGRSRHQRPRHPLSARPGAGRVVLDQRADLHPRPARGFRPLGAARQSRLGLGRCAALFQEGRELAGRGERTARLGRVPDHLADERAAGGRARRSSRPPRNSGSNTAPTSTICRPAPATASAGASRPAADGAGPAPREPI